MDLTPYDLIVLSTSGGKDSAVAAWTVTEMARTQGVLDRVVAHHATFREEWPGTTALVHRQCQALGVTDITVVQRHEALLDYVERRGKWPSMGQRYCTSDFKRGPLLRALTASVKARTPTYRPARVLYVDGRRAAESPKRARLTPFTPRIGEPYGNGRRRVDYWLPIFPLSTPEVWAIIQREELEMHPAYAAGIPRLSCSFCIFASRGALIRAGQLRPDLLAEYVRVEQTIGHTFRKDLPIAEIAAAVAAQAPAGVIDDWTM